MTLPSWVISTGPMGVARRSTMRRMGFLLPPTMP
jgi:hypothetical protein